MNRQSDDVVSVPRDRALSEVSCASTHDYIRQLIAEKELLARIVVEEKERQEAMEQIAWGSAAQLDEVQSLRKRVGMAETEVAELRAQQTCDEWESESCSSFVSQGTSVSGCGFDARDVKQLVDEKHLLERAVLELRARQETLEKIAWGDWTFEDEVQSLINRLTAAEMELYDIRSRSAGAVWPELSGEKEGSFDQQITRDVSPSSQAVYESSVGHHKRAASVDTPEQVLSHTQQSTKGCSQSRSSHSESEDVRQLIADKQDLERAFEEMKKKNLELERRLAERCAGGPQCSDHTGDIAESVGFDWKKRALQLQDQLRLGTYAAHVSAREELSRAQAELFATQSDLSKSKEACLIAERQVVIERENNQRSVAQWEQRVRQLESTCCSLRVQLEHREEETKAFDERIIQLLRSQEAAMIECDQLRKQVQTSKAGLEGRERLTTCADQEVYRAPTLPVQFQVAPMAV